MTLEVNDLKNIHIDVGKMVQELKDVERKRRMYLMLPVAGTILFFVFFVMLMENGEGEGFLIGMPFVAILCVGMIWFSIYKYMKLGYDALDSYKEIVVRPVVRAMLPGTMYRPKQGFQSEEYQNMHLKRSPCFQYKSEDLLDGQCKGIAFRQADIEIIRPNDNKHIAYDVNGQLREFEFEKPVEGTVLLGPHGGDLDVQPGMNKVEFENVEFNLMFDVYAEDAHSAFYIITPHFMEYLTKLSNDSDEIYMSFDGEKLRLLQSGKGGIFNPPSNLSDIAASIDDQIENIKKDLKQIEEVIDILHLGTEQE